MDAAQLPHGEPAPLDGPRQQGHLRQGQTISSNPTVGYRSSSPWIREPDTTEIADDLGQRLEGASELEEATAFLVPHTPCTWCNSGTNDARTSKGTCVRVAS